MFLLFEYFRNLEEYSGLLHIAELMVYRCAEQFHGGGESHICIHERRNVPPGLANLMIENAQVFLKGVACKHPLHIGVVGMSVKRFYRLHEFVWIGEMLVQKPEKHIATFRSVVRIHSEFAEEIFYLRIFHREGAEPVPEIVEGIKRLGSGLGGLLFKSYERAAKFQGVGEIFLYKPV